MGFYINDLPNGEPLPALGKAQALLDAGIAEETEFVSRFADIPEDKAMIAVVDNGIFDAAGFVDTTLYQQIEYERRHEFTRPMTFLLMDRELAMKLSGLWDYLDMVNRPKEE